MDKNGCTQNDSILIRVVIDYTFYFPNIFTPNNDGNNDIFFPQSNIFGNESTIEIFQIYDRWGNNVFTKKDIKFNQPEEGWNGYYKGKIANQGVYAYFVKISLPDGTEKQFVGDVSLIR